MIWPYKLIDSNIRLGIFSHLSLAVRKWGWFHASHGNLYNFESEGISSLYAIAQLLGFVETFWANFTYVAPKRRHWMHWGWPSMKSTKLTGYGLFTLDEKLDGSTQRFACVYISVSFCFSEMHFFTISQIGTQYLLEPIQQDSEWSWWSMLCFFRFFK